MVYGMCITRSIWYVMIYSKYNSLLKPAAGLLASGLIDFISVFVPIITSIVSIILSLYRESQEDSQYNCILCVQLANISP